MAFRVLIIDDDLAALEKAKSFLRSESDLTVETTTSVSEALASVRGNPYAYAVVLVDLWMPEMKGADLTRELLQINPSLVIAISSADLSKQALRDAWQAGAVDFLEKEISEEAFRSKVRSFCCKFEETAQVFLETAQDSNDVEAISLLGMNGRSKAMADAARLVKQAAATDCSLLIQGESGTGKELVARSVHRLSKRRQKPFIAINVANLGDNLLESDLFGHERGSFTGADRQKVGKFLAANGGTMFLDEIGEMKIELQAKLLRVLQEGEFTPVGALNPIKVDVRIVAATHVDLEKAVREKRFREDLYYRLNVVKVQVPALRERPEDIQPLISHFKEKFGGDNKVILMKTIRYMERYAWPGNIRELENEMEKLITIVPATKIEPTHLSSKFFEERTPKAEDEFDCTYEEFISRQRLRERAYLEKHLKRGSIREVAQHHLRAPLGTIYGRMQKLGIQYEKKGVLK